jgi:two-component system, OmpR family, phosphate regulon sensor histidine kinase PhoR
MRSLQWRLVIPLSIFLAFSLIALGTFLSVSYRADQLANIQSRLRQEAILAGRAAQPFLSQPAETDSLVKELGREADIRLTIISPDGTVFADSWENPAAMENHLDRPEVIDALASGYGQSTRYSTTLDYEMLYVAVAIRNDTGDTAGVSRVALPVSQVRLATGRILGTAVLAVVVAIIVMVAGVWAVSRSVNHPLQQLTRDVKRVAGGEIGAATTVAGGGEIGALAHAFNIMSARLAGTVVQLEGDKNRLAAMLSHIADGVVLSDDEGKLVLANKAAGRIFGFNEQCVAGRPVIEAVRDHEVVDMLRQALDRGRETSLQFESMANHCFLQAISVPLRYNQSLGVLLLFQDLTELRGLQTMRKELIGNISHEFRTPLAGIRAIVETLQDGALNEPQVARDFLVKIRGEVDRLTQMVAELTDLSRIESGRTELKKQALNINELILEVMEQLIPLANRGKLKMETHLAENLPVIMADRDNIRQVISNLLHNAVKFTPAGGSITVTTSCSNHDIITSVADTGTGIAPEDLPHVFERFFKADRARSDGGTGLGLAIVKHTIQTHGGQVRAESVPGKGSTFTFTLPQA